MRFDRAALIAGLIFIALGTLYLLEEIGVIDVSSGFVVPVALIGLGIGLLLGRGGRAPRSPEPPPEPPPEPLSPAPPEERV